MFRGLIRVGRVVPSVGRTSVLANAYKPIFMRNYAGFPSLTRDIAKERIYELLEGYDKIDGSKELAEELSFVQDLGLDSLDVVEVIMEVEHEFNIQIPDDEADKLKTIKQTIDFILAQDDAV